MTIAYRPDDLKTMQRELAAAIAKEKTTIVFSLDHLPTLDMTGLRGLITLLRSARAAGAEIALRTANPQIRRMLAVTALDQIFRVHTNEEVAA